jgi:hypothetical protein
MLRKTLVALAAVAALGSLALAPTSASAGGKFFKHKHVGIGFGYPGYYPGYAFGPSCFYVEKWTPFGIVVKKVCRWY